MLNYITQFELTHLEPAAGVPGAIVAWCWD